jgi:hypothetical protein
MLYYRIIEWITGVTRKDRIRNEYVRDSISIVLIVNKIRENRPR